MGKTAIEIDGVSKAYHVYPTPRHQALEMFTLGMRVCHTNFWALRDVTLRVEPGTTLGIVGRNGSGKSTLLHLIAGITRATRGHITVLGRISSLLELGAGFHPEFTGRANVELFGVVMGLPLHEIRARLPVIEAFAGIGEFIDRPVKVYSSGMFVRLAFAAAIYIDPDVLLVDEALAVGDVAFQHQCIRRIQELQAGGTTIVFVSHDMAMIQAISTEVVMLEAGRVEAQGDPATIANLYHARTAAIAVASDQQRPGGDGVRFQDSADFEERTKVFRHGTGAARIRQVQVLDSLGRSITSVAFDEEVVLRVHVAFREDVPVCILGFGIRDKTGVDIVGTNTYEEGATLPPRRANETFVVDFRLRLPLPHGNYSISTALAYDRSEPRYLDWVDNALIITVLAPESGKTIYGKVWLPVQITVHTA